jgi:pyruvate-ferredoxin/flavodoxin oxidoreductase
MRKSQAEEKLAADAGHWPLYRYNPALTAEGKHPFTWESKEPSVDFKDYILNEIRYKSLQAAHPDEAKRLFDLAEKDAKIRFESLKALSKEE